MTPLVLGVTLSLALLGGFAAGWLAGKASGLAMPNALVATLVLTAGSLGGPVATYTLFGAGTMSYVAALLLAGFSAGLSFWPMGETQGERKWL